MGDGAGARAAIWRYRVKYESEAPTPYAVHCVETFDVGKPPCNGGDLIYLTAEGYDSQMSMPDARWKCPRCGGQAIWSDDNFEERTFASGSTE